MAVMVCVPLAAVKLVEPLLTLVLLPAPPASGTAAPKLLPSTVNCTEPVGFTPVALVLVTLAVKVSGWPLTTLAGTGVTVVLVVSAVAVTSVLGLVDELKLPSEFV